MRLLNASSLNRHLFRWYGLVALIIILILGLTPLIVLSASIDRDVRKSLEQTTHSIEQIINYGTEQAIRYRLTNEALSALREIRTIYQAAVRGELSAAEAKKHAQDYLLSRPVGREGYFYVIDSTGNIVLHPHESLVGTSQLDFPFIREQAETREGFIEYMWQNPGEDLPRRKALSMAYFEEWDWIISAAAYRTDFPELFDIHDLEEFILSLGDGKREYSFVLDKEGTFLIHPFSQGISLSREAGTAGNALRELINSSPSGFLSYSWKQDDKDQLEKKLLYFTRISDFDWVIASSVFLTDVREPLRNLGLAMIILSLGTLLLFLLLSIRFSRTITRPLEQLIKGLNRGERGDYSLRAETFAINELNTLGNHFNRFMEQLAQSRTDKQNLDTLRILSETVFDNTIEGITITDLEGNIRSVNQAFTEITGYSSEEAVGRNPRILKSEHHEPDFYIEMWDRLKSAENWSGEIWNRRKNGEAYPEWLTITCLRDENGLPSGYIAIFHDISDQKKTEARLKYQAYHDALTGLPNRELFKDRLDVALASANRNDEKGAVVFMDLDDFKQVNDSLGHQLGDQYLKEIATRLRLAIREEDTVARLGGDEFTLLLPKITNQKGAVEVVERIINDLGEPFLLGTKTIHPRGSFGITFYPDDGSDSGRLMRNADMAMYRTKHRGDGSYTLFSEHIERRSRRRTILEERLRRAVVDGHLQVFYQPQYNIIEERCIGFEALIRWQDPEEGWISPVEFIPIAEMIGIISPIDTWLLRRALTEIGELNRHSGKSYTLSVNISAVQFKEEAFVESIRTSLAETGFKAELLELEITESTAMRNVALAVRKMEQLSETGVKFAIDDFGTGYSSLSYLNRLKASTLKIDQSFIQELASSPEAEAVATSIIGLGNSLGLTVIAEGVETAEQLRLLQAKECPVVQGFLFGRPIPYIEIDEYIDTFAYPVTTDETGETAG